MKHLLLFLLSLIVGGLIAGIGILWALDWHRPPQKPAATITSQGPTVERLERLSRLVVVRVAVAEVFTGKGEGYRGAWLIKGDALIGVDLRRAQILEKDKAARRATIRLSLPAVVQSRVDHQRTKTWEVRRTTWVPWRGDQDRLRDEVMAQAQNLVARAAGSSENLAQARAAAEAILRGIYEEVGWQVQLVWQEAPASPAVPNPSPGAGTDLGE